MIALVKLCNPGVNRGESESSFEAEGVSNAWLAIGCAFGLSSRANFCSFPADHLQKHVTLLLVLRDGSKIVA